MNSMKNLIRARECDRMALEVNVSTQEIGGTLHYFRDGIEVEKGVELTSERIDRNLETYEKICEKFTAYPDLSI